MICLDPILEKSMKRADTSAALGDDVYDMIDLFISDKDTERVKKELDDEENANKGKKKSKEMEDNSNG